VIAEGRWAIRVVGILSFNNTFISHNDQILSPSSTLSPSMPTEASKEERVDGNTSITLPHKLKGEIEGANEGTNEGF
jgi:hypothetical protein